MSGPRKPYTYKDWIDHSTACVVLIVFHVLTLLNLWIFGPVSLLQHCIITIISAAILLLVFYIRWSRSVRKYGNV